MASASSTPSPPHLPEDDDDAAADLPMTMAASVILENLPKDAHAALETAGELKDANGEIKGKGSLICLFNVLWFCSNRTNSQSPPITTAKHESLTNTCIQLWHFSTFRICCSISSEEAAAQGARERVLLREFRVCSRP